MATRFEPGAYHPNPDSPGGRSQIDTAERFAAWRSHFLPTARAEVQVRIGKGEYLPDIEHSAGLLAEAMACGPTQRGEWPEGLQP